MQPVLTVVSKIQFGHRSFGMLSKCTHPFRYGQRVGGVVCEGRSEVISVCDVNGERGVVGQSTGHRLLHGTNKATGQVSVGAVAAAPLHDIQ